MNSCYLRELTFGKFIIKCEELTLSENIGQGMYHSSMFSSMVYIMSLLEYLCVILHLAGEFGIVYRARFSPQGRPSREVAIKTLKGWSIAN